MRAFNISSTFQNILRFQAGIMPSFKFTNFRAISSVSATDPNIDRTISYWFGGDNVSQKWFDGGPEVDAEIKEQFGDLVEDARAAKLSSWTEQPNGTLALILLLDQFPRNIYRGSPLSYSSDSMASTVATEAIAKGIDRQLPHIQQIFFYIPLMHDERLISQIASIALYEAMGARCPPDSLAGKFLKSSLQFAERHKDCILRFGRYPARNDVLGRVSTDEEIKYLKENPTGF